MELESTRRYPVVCNTTRLLRSRLPKGVLVRGRMRALAGGSVWSVHYMVRTWIALLGENDAMS